MSKSHEQIVSLIMDVEIGLGEFSALDDLELIEPRE